MWYWGTEEQKKVLGEATSDSTGEWIAGYGASKPAGTPGGTATSTPRSPPAGISVTARLDGDSYVLNGRKYWPRNVGGWDGKGANTSLYVVRTDPAKGGTEGLASILVDRGTPGVTFNTIDSFGHRLTPNSEVIWSSTKAANARDGNAGARRGPS